MYASVHRFCAHGCDLAPVLSLQQKRRLIGMLTHFSATYLLSALVLFPLLQWVTVFLPLKIKLAEIIKIDFDYLEMLCTAMWWIQSIYIEPHRLRHTLFLFSKWLAQQFQNLSIFLDMNAHILQRWNIIVLWMVYAIQRSRILITWTHHSKKNIFVAATILI